MSSHSILACDGPSTEKPDNSHSAREGPGAPGRVALASPCPPPGYSHCSHLPHPGCPRFVTNGLHNKVCRLATDTALQPRAPCPHLLIAALSAHFLTPRRGLQGESHAGSAEGPIMEAGWPEPCRGGGVPPLKRHPGPHLRPIFWPPHVIVDGVCAGDHGVIPSHRHHHPGPSASHALRPLSGDKEASGLC